MGTSEQRRRFLNVVLTGGGAAVLGSSAIAAAATPQEEAEVTPSEDLMREHGVLRRVLLVYEEAARSLSAGEKLPADLLTTTAGIVRKFVEDYHERVEETEVFPRLQKAGKKSALVKTLLAQHQAGRKLTATILDNARAATQGTPAPRTAVLDAIAAFARMYRPHAAREDTELFPEFQKLFTRAEFDRLGDRFEEAEHKMLGSTGFEGTLAQVVQLDKSLGIDDLARFTPR
jgi:hemerythrin-like domain-containing protein